MKNNTYLRVVFLAIAAWLFAGSMYAQHAHEYDDHGVCTVEGCTDMYQAPAYEGGVWKLSNAGNVEWVSQQIEEVYRYNAETGEADAEGSFLNLATFEMTNDIDFTGVKHTPIGRNHVQKFNGVFDGKGFRIKNLVITPSDELGTAGGACGFFGWVRGGSTVQNLVIDASCSFHGGQRTAALMGMVQVKNGGQNLQINIINCVNMADVTSATGVAAPFIGAGAPNNDHPIVVINHCVNTGTIKGASDNKGASFIGWLKSGGPNSRIENSYSIGECSPLDGTNNMFRGQYREIHNSYDLCPQNTTDGTGTGTQGLKGTAFITADPLNSGELAYVLNGRKNGGLFTQTLGTGIPMPFEGDKVYAVATYICDGSYTDITGFTNEEPVLNAHQFDPETGLCTVCSMPDEEFLTTDAEGFYHLSTVDHVEWFSQMVRKAYHGGIKGKLDNDIDFENVENRHFPIGTSGHKFFGHFDGQGHRILNMKFTADFVPDDPYDGVGFFGSVRGGGTDAAWDKVYNDEVIIENLIIDSSCSINTDRNFVAGVVGHINSTNSLENTICIRNCGNEADIISTGKNIAGILGCVESTQVGIRLLNCYNTGTISGGMESATICAWTGQSNDALTKEVKNCWNIGDLAAGLDGFGYNMFRVPLELVPENVYDLNPTEGATQGLEAGLTLTDAASGKLTYLINKQAGERAFAQTLGTDEHPSLDLTHGIVNYIDATGYATQYIPDTDVTIPAGVEAYAGKLEGENTLKLYPLSGQISKEDAVVLWTEMGDQYFSFLPTTGATKADNDLLGTAMPTQATGTEYILADLDDSSVGFCVATPNTFIPAGKAYLNINNGAKSIHLMDGATAIEGVKAMDEPKDTRIYNLQGQRIHQVRKGINIVNGKKIVVR